MILKEDYENITQAILLLTKVIKNAGAFEDEQRREREFEQKLIKMKRESDIYFTKKEIAAMPIQFQKIINVDIPLKVRQKKNGVFEARFRTKGFNITVSSKDYTKLKTKFLEALNVQKDAHVKEPFKQTIKTLTFKTIALKWLNLKRATIKKTTIKMYEQLFGTYIIPKFGDAEIDKIKQSDVQLLLNDFIKTEKYRTAEKLFQTLNAIFNFAVGEDLITKSPMRLLRAPKYEKRTGTALTLKEEKTLLILIEKSKCCSKIKNALRFLLYTGIRRSELKSARIENGFISVICSKTRKGFSEKRRSIPITPMLKRSLIDMNVSKLNEIKPNALTQAMKRIMPEHHLHELRHTFITRCQECGVAREIVSVWAGHAPDNTITSNVYTHFSKEFMLEQANKVNYTL